MAKIFKDYKELEGYDKKLAKELLDTVGEGGWQSDELQLYGNIEDFAHYEVTEGWYSSLGINFDTDYKGAPDLLDHIDLLSLGIDLESSWDGNCNFKSDDGRVITTSYGW